MKVVSLKDWMEKVSSALIKPNMWTGATSAAVSTTASYYGAGTDILSTNYKTNTGRFIVIGIVPLKTSRFTSRAMLKVDGITEGYAGTNHTSALTISPVVTYEGTKGATYTVALAIGAQDSGTTASVEAYNYSALIIFDVGGGVVRKTLNALQSLTLREVIAW